MPDEKPIRLRLLLAVQTRELKRAFFLALAAKPSLRIIATAANTAELLTYSRTLQPDRIVLEWELAGKPVAEVYPQLTTTTTPSQIFVINRPSSDRQVRELTPNAERFDDPESLIRALETLHVSEKS